MMKITKSGFRYDWSNSEIVSSSTKTYSLVLNKFIGATKVSIMITSVNMAF